MHWPDQSPNFEKIPTDRNQFSDFKGVKENYRHQHPIRIVTICSTSETLSATY